jgi:oligopeptide/dipeptide ABC transporter ATP-binding protein
MNDAFSRKVLQINNLRTYFDTEDGTLKAVDGVSFSVMREQSLGIIGESGCGKSVTAQSILQIVPPPGYIQSGEILYTGRGGDTTDIAQLDPMGKEIHAIRGKEIAIVFQEPMSSLSPVHSIGDQIMEGILLHVTKNKSEAREIAIDMLDKVHIPNPSRVIDEYPHQLSGGMRQRGCIAMALACNPFLLIADEPTTAIDVTIQAQILELLAELQQQLHMSILYITHDLGVIAETCEDVAVMYLGSIVEFGPVRAVFDNPLHPYTQDLLAAIPDVGSRKSRLATIKGTVPTPINLPEQCGYCTRCQVMTDEMNCQIAIPGLVEHEPKHYVRCFNCSPEQEDLDLH